MSSNWKVLKFGDLYETASGLSKSRKEFGFGSPFVSFKDVFWNYFLPVELESLANTTKKEQERCSVKKGDIFLTRTSETPHELGMSSVALKDYPDTTFNGFTKRLRLKDSVDIKIDPVYLGYYLRSDLFRQSIYAHSSMTTRASLNNSAISSLDLITPPYEEQVSIGKKLKVLDDKIANNNRINETLEEIAQALFKSWFVDFEPVKAKMNAKAEGKDPHIAAMCALSGKTEEEINDLHSGKKFQLGITAMLFPDNLVESELGLIPEGWGVDCIGNYFPTMGGYAFKGKDFIESGEAVIKIKNIKENGKVDLWDTQKIAKKVAESKGKFELVDGEIVMAMTGATIGKVGIIVTQAEKVYLNQRVAKFNLKEKQYKNSWFVFQFFKQEINRNLILSTAQGSAQPNISTGGIDSVKAVFPSKELIREFNNKGDSLYNKWMNNERESIKLSEIRDHMLPKLLSGDFPLLKSDDNA